MTTHDNEHGAAPRYSIWGPIQHCEEFAPGIWSICTATHGGLILSPARQSELEERLGFTPRLWNGAERSYEEDCDWLIVVLAFPELFNDQHRADANTYGQKIAQRTPDCSIAKAWRAVQRHETAQA
jgi:hypothetical protein